MVFGNCTIVTVLCNAFLSATLLMFLPTEPDPRQRQTPPDKSGENKHPDDRFWKPIPTKRVSRVTSLWPWKSNRTCSGYYTKQHCA